MGLKESVKGLFGKKQKSITDSGELEKPDQQSLKSNSFIDVEDDIKNFWEKLNKRDIINQEFPTEDDLNKITDILDRCTIDEYALVKSSDGYHIVRKKSLNERLNEIYRENSSSGREIRIKEGSKEEKSR